MELILICNKHISKYCFCYHFRKKIKRSIHHCVRTYCSVAFTECHVGLTVSYFYLVSRNTKLYETGHCFAEFRSFRETGQNTKIRKKGFELFRETEKNVSFRSFAYFRINFVLSLRIVYLLF